MSEPFIGEIRIFGGSYAYEDWALCNGATLPVIQNTSLFSVISTNYGGNGSTDFKLPDLRGHAPMGSGEGVGLTERIIGDTTGNELATIDRRNLPVHNHTIAATDTAGTTNQPDNTKIFAKPNYVAKRKVYQNAYAGPNTGDPHNEMAEKMVSDAGGGLFVDHENRQPFLVLTFLIALDGMYPQRT